MAKKVAPKKDPEVKKEKKIKETKPKAVLQNEELKQSLEQEKEKYLRLFAEFENFKKRTAKERIELFKTANKEVLSAMIPVLDDFNRANQQIEKEKGAVDQEGFQLIHNKFFDVLKANGLTQTEVKVGDTFDPEIHEAITQIPAANDKEKGKLIDIIEVGYQLGDRIIRYPKVVVGQ
ncbi:MAG: nucleotide exchange factor GrpE [Flavobacteriaceae bacterium]